MKSLLTIAVTAVTVLFISVNVEAQFIGAPALSQISAPQLAGSPVFEITPKLQPKMECSSLKITRQNGAGQQSYQGGINRSMPNLAGPRFGFTIISGALADELKDEHGLNPIVTQFGYQKETRFYSTGGGFHGITEFVILIGGVEQGMFLPSLSWLIGMRSDEGFEFAVGPNIGAGGAALAVAFGGTKRFGELNIPFNIAFVPSKTGVRVSLLTGFNMVRNR